jgi:RHS repeat-associated protein
MSVGTAQDFTITKTPSWVVDDTQRPSPWAFSSSAPGQPLQYLNRNRFYRPDIGRFLSGDPLPNMLFVRESLRPSGSPAQMPIQVLSPHPYTYAGSRPTGLSDPLGLDAVGIFRGGDCSNTGPACDGYRSCDEFWGANAGCVCRCAGNDDWSQTVRCCLRKLIDRGWTHWQAHSFCYSYASTVTGIPNANTSTELGACYLRCVLEQSRKCCGR